MQRLVCFILTGLLLSAPAAAAELSFPELSGRVVDEAGILSAGVEANLSGMLDRHERETSNQVVVVALKSLQGYTIEEFGYRLGRHWGIGQEGRNNGALLIVALDERKVRIEVGYGLEGALTDALSKTIIETEIVPRLRANDFPAGIHAGVVAILKAIEGTYEATGVTKRRNVDPRQEVAWIMLVMVLAFVLVPVIWAWKTGSASGFGVSRLGYSDDYDDDFRHGTGGLGSGRFGSGGFGGGGFGGGGASGGF